MCLRSRVRHIYDLMEKNGIDALFLLKKPNIVYVSGVEAEAAVIADRPTIIAYDYMDDFAIPEGYSLVTIGPRVRGMTLEVKSPLKTIRWRSGMVVAFDQLPHPSWIEWLKQRGVRMRLSRIVEELRVTKDRCEIDAILKAREITKRVISEIEWGNEKEMVGEAWYLAYKYGDGFGFPPIVACDHNTPFLHHQPTPDRCERLRLLDLGVKVGYYMADITVTEARAPVRMFGMEFSEVVSVLEEAMDVAREYIQPGLKALEVDLAVREFLKGKGLLEYFPHYTGHGIGIEYHEPPFLGPGMETPLRRGMVLAIEVGLYKRGKYGVRLEDDFVV